MQKIKILLMELMLKFKMALFFEKTEEFKTLHNKKKIIVGLAADYGNLGDVAITYAQKKYLSETYPDYTIIEIPISQTFSRIKALKKVCNKNDIVTTVGGGNMGDLYWGTELERQLFFKLFKKNKIISFPQSIEFSNTKKGKARLKHTCKIYNNCHDLTLLVREKKSFEQMKEFFPNAKILLVPDVVMTLDEERVFFRDKITVCLRDDQEQKLTSKEKNDIMQNINKKYTNVIRYDTHIGRNKLTLEERTFELNKIWDLFSSSKIVITDRLHGMIFCYITKTPCIALQNSNYKVKGCYEWIKECGFIHLCEDNEIEKIMKTIEDMIGYDYSAKDLKLGEIFKVTLRENNVSKI